jgi:hypothetical protein
MPEQWDCQSINKAFMDKDAELKALIDGQADRINKMKKEFDAAIKNHEERIAKLEGR